MAVPYTFGSATAAIPLSNLDSNFATTITLGNTAIQLGNTVTTLNNMTLANVTVSSGNVTTANITTLTVGSGGIKSAGNVVVGTIDYTNTAVTGAMAVNGYGIYPSVSTGTTNTTNYSGIQWYTPTAWAGNNGASALTLQGISSVINVKNDGSGGTNITRGDALIANSYVESSGVAARVRSQGLTTSGNRYSATDLSTRTDNQIFGAVINASHTTTAPGTIVSSNLQAISVTAQNQSGTAALQIGVGSSFNVGSTAGAPTTASTQAYAFISQGYTVGQATGNAATVTTGAAFYGGGPTVSATGTMTTYYGLYLGSATVTGTLTNNYGVYSADTAATNYFGGTVGIGTTSPTAGYKLSLATGGIRLSGTQATAGATGAIDTQAYNMANSTYQLLGYFLNNGLGGGAVAEQYAGVFKCTTEASAYTAGVVGGIVVLTNVKGAGSTVTENYGILINEQTIGATNYGLRSAVSSGSNKWNIYADGTASNYFAGTVGIGTTSPSASAILDAQSTTKGVRMPNMTTTQKNAISSPAAGLMVFDTTLSKLCVYSGAAWQTITSV